MVITQYKYQQQLIFDCLNEELSDNSTIEVLTVDKCQGKDKECVIVSFVRSNNEQKVSSTACTHQRSYCMRCVEIIHRVHCPSQEY